MTRPHEQSGPVHFRRVGCDHRMHENAPAKSRVCHFILAQRGGAEFGENQSDDAHLGASVWGTACSCAGSYEPAGGPTACNSEVPELASVDSTEVGSRGASRCSGRDLAGRVLIARKAPTSFCVLSCEVYCLTWWRALSYRGHMVWRLDFETGLIHRVAGQACRATPATNGHVSRRRAVRRRGRK